MGGNISRDPTNDHTQNYRHSSSSSPSPATRRSKTSTSRNSKSNSVSEEKKVLVKPDKRVISNRTYHATESSCYMLPRDDDEIDRLHSEHFLIKELLGYNIMMKALQTLDFEKNNLQVLDVCCGPATWLFETSLDFPICDFTGIDMCSLWPQVIRPVNVNFTEANVLQGIPYPDKTFDFVQMRFVVLAFRKNEWPFVISEIKRVLKDGGLFQWVELDMRITTKDPTASKHTEAFESFCASYDLDASVGANLDLLLTERGGMNKLHSEYKQVPLGWGGAIGSAYIDIFLGALDGLSPWLKPSLGIENRDFETKLRGALAHSKAFIGLYAFLVQKPMID